MMRDTSAEAHRPWPSAGGWSGRASRIGRQQHEALERAPVGALATRDRTLRPTNGRQTKIAHSFGFCAIRR